MRGVGDIDGSVKIVTVVIFLDSDISIENLGTLEVVQALDLQSLLKVDLVLASQATGLDLGLAIDGDTDRLVIMEPDVEASKGLHISDVESLADVDDLVLIGCRRGEQKSCEWRVWLEILEVHVTLEAVDLSVDLAVGRDGRVDLHEIAVGLGLKNVDTLDLQFGLVNLCLSNLGHSNENSVRRCVSLLGQAMMDSKKKKGGGGEG